MRKEDFLEKYRDTIVEWVKIHKKDILNYKNYRWKNKTYEESVNERNELEESIRDSKERNMGGIDLKTVDRIYRRGFGKEFP